MFWLQSVLTSLLMAKPMLKIINIDVFLRCFSVYLFNALLRRIYVYNGDVMLLVVEFVCE